MNVLKEDTEKKIVKAAREVFIEKGLQGSRMQEIADRAGINKALLHYYFRSKDKMFDAVFNDIMTQLFAGFIPQLDDDMTATDLMKTYITYYNKSLRENPFISQFIFHEIWQNPERLSNFISSLAISPEDLIRKVSDEFPQFADSKYFHAHMFANVLGMVLFPHIARPLAKRVLFDNNDDAYDEFLNERTDFLINMLSSSMEDSEKIETTPDEDF